MEVMIETRCGIDVHQKSIVCCILDGLLDTNKPKKIQKKFGTTTVALHNALAWILEKHVTHVFFESTGQYWLPLFNIFSDSDLVLVLANPQHIKNVPGRCGLIEPSYIPAPEVMQLRLLTRRMRSYKQRQTQVKNKIHNLLQRANIKLTSYLSDIFSKTGQALLKLFIDGETINVESVIPCIQKRVKASPEELVEAMEGKLSLADRFLLDQSLEEYQMYQELIEKLTDEIQHYIEKEFP